MKYFVFFGTVSLTLFYLAAISASIPYALILLNVGLAFGGIGLAFGTGRPGVFMKKPSGRLSFLSYLIFWPYFMLNQLYLYLFRRSAEEHAIDEIWPGIFLGCQLFENDRELISSKGIKGTLDVTSEFAETNFILESHDYLNIPLVDTCAPTTEQLVKAVDWLSKQQSKGPIFIHCAVGHGRSATIAAAFMVKENLASSADEALRVIKKIRPSVGLKPSQMAALEAYVESI